MQSHHQQPINSTNAIGSAAPGTSNRDNHSSSIRTLTGVTGGNGIGSIGGGVISGGDLVGSDQQTIRQGARELFKLSNANGNKRRGSGERMVLNEGSQSGRSPSNGVITTVSPSGDRALHTFYGTNGSENTAKQRCATAVTTGRTVHRKGSTGQTIHSIVNGGG